MSAPDAPPRRPPSFLRVWLPVLLVALWALGVVGIWAWPDPDWAKVYRVVSTFGSAVLLLMLLGIWFVLFSGVRLWVRAVVVLAGVAALLFLPRALVREVHFSGNMVPVVHFRWEPPEQTWLSPADPSALRPVGDLSGAGPDDYPAYRGRRRDGIVQGPALARAWATPKRPVWRHPCGGGYAGFAIAGNAAVTIEQRAGQEVVACYDTATGQERWVYEHPARFSEAMGGDGPRATPTIADGQVYSLGATGHLACLDAATGSKKWSVEILDGEPNVAWGMSGSPLVYDNLVVVNPGRQSDAAKDRALVAYDRATGKLVWSAGNARAGYSSPQLATLAGRRQVLIFDAVGIGGYDAATGKELWRFDDWKTQQGINVAQPLVLDGDRVFISSAYGMGCAMLRVSEADGKWSVKPLWKTTKMRCRFTSPVAYQRHLYGLDEGILVCLDAADGSRKWRGGRYDHGQLLLSGDLLVILAEDGDLALAEATPAAARELGRFHALDGKTWNYPALAGGRAYVRNDHEMACYDLTAPAAPGASAKDTP
ncbi:MAG TPA: PQQ-binding-like beta-propeller repeat protein [Gemmataceae bacterium]|nr:PQQ-binding-like beta-propeller repeat protein [Gemmataceae bacterium]